MGKTAWDGDRDGEGWGEAEGRRRCVLYVLGFLGFVHHIACVGDFTYCENCLDEVYNTIVLYGRTHTMNVFYN